MNLKKIWLFVILPAVITGFFAFLPTLYQQWTQPKARLTYEASIGPEVKAEGEAFRIGTVTVKNNGSKILTGVHAQVAAPLATIQAFGLGNEGILPVRAVAKGGQLDLSAVSLLPGESLSATFLLRANNAVALPNIAARSNEIRGVPPVIEKKTGWWVTGATSALFVATIVSAMLSYVLTNTSGRASKALQQIVNSAPQKQDLIRYVAIRAGVAEFASHPEVVGRDISYLRASDVLLGIALSIPAKSEACANACRAFLLIDQLSEISMQLIVRNIKAIDNDALAEVELPMLRRRSVSVMKSLEIRAQIDAFLDSPAGFLTAPA